MRTTIRLDDQLLKETKVAAAESGRTFTYAVETALREWLARLKAPPRREPIKLITFSGDLQPGVDLDDSAGLLELMEGPYDPS